MSIIIGLGNYTGGWLVVNDIPIKIKDKFVEFDGKQTHYTKPFRGTRYSIIFFTVKPRWLKKKWNYYRNIFVIKPTQQQHRQSSWSPHSSRRATSWSRSRKDLRSTCILGMLLWIGSTLALSLYLLLAIAEYQIVGVPHLSIYGSTSRQWCMSIRREHKKYVIGRSTTIWTRIKKTEMFLRYITFKEFSF